MEPSTHWLAPSPYAKTGTKHSQLRPKLVNTRNEERDTERSTHHRILVVHTLSKAKRKVAHGLRRALDLDALVVGERVVLRRHARVVDHRARVRGEPGHGAAEVAVDLHDLLDRGRLEEGRLYALLDAEDDAFGRAHADGCRAQLGGGVSAP